MKESRIDRIDLGGIVVAVLVTAAERMLPRPVPDLIQGFFALLVLGGSVSIGRLMLLIPVAKGIGAAIGIGLFLLVYFGAPKFNLVTSLTVMIGWGAMWYVAALSFGVKRNAS